MPSASPDGEALFGFGCRVIGLVRANRCYDGSSFRPVLPPLGLIGSSHCWHAQARRCLPHRTSLVRRSDRNRSESEQYCAALFEARLFVSRSRLRFRKVLPSGTRMETPTSRFLLGPCNPCTNPAPHLHDAPTRYSCLHFPLVLSSGFARSRHGLCRWHQQRFLLAAAPGLRPRCWRAEWQLLRLLTWHARMKPSMACLRRCTWPHDGIFSSYDHAS